MTLHRLSFAFRGLARVPVVLALITGCSSESPQTPLIIGTGSGGSTATPGAGGSPDSTPVPGMGGTNGGIVIPPAAGSNQGGAGGMENCGAEGHKAELKPLALFLLVDQSTSMTDGVDRWTPVSTAVRTFIQDPGSVGIKVALSYFPFTSTEQAVKCDAVSYGMPAVPMASLPENVTPIIASLDSKPYMQGDTPMERSSTPTRPAYEGSVGYLSTWLQQNPDHIGVFVLATDGEPSTCQQNSVQQIAASIQMANAGTPPIRTYVIGIGNIANLNQFAMAGGTNTPFIVDGTGTNTQAEFLAAMKAIRGAALPCEFSVPVPMNGTPDPTKVNVDYQPGSGGAPVPLFKVADSAACAATPNGWYYDNPTMPRSVVLCPSACMQVTSDEKASVGIALGCDTRVK